mgnify:CR=1 FL=1
MKQRTATFQIYTPYGTSRSSRHVDVRYRGKLLAEFSGDNESNLIAYATHFARCSGYNKIKTVYIVGGA